MSIVKTMEAKLRKAVSAKVDEIDVINSLDPGEVIISAQVNGFLLRFTKDASARAQGNAMAKVISYNLINNRRREYFLGLPCALSREILVSYATCGVFMLDVKWNVIYQRSWAGTFSMFLRRIFIISNEMILAYERATGKLLGKLSNETLRVPHILGYYGSLILFARKEKHVAGRLVNYYCVDYEQPEDPPKYILSVDMCGFFERTHTYQTKYLVIRLKPRNGCSATHHVIDLREMKWIKTIECTGEILWKGHFYIQRIEGKYSEKNLFYTLGDELFHQEGFGRFFGSLFVSLSGTNIIFKDIKRGLVKKVAVEESTDKNNVYLFQNGEIPKKEWIMVHKTIAGKNLIEDYVEIKIYELMVRFDVWRRDSFWFLPWEHQRDVIMALWARHQKGCFLEELPLDVFLEIMNYI